MLYDAILHTTVILVAGAIQNLHSHFCVVQPNLIDLQTTVVLLLHFNGTPMDI